MKIKYEFANETVEVEVSEEWGNIVVDLNRQEYNINQKETRRHCSLEAYNLDDALLPSDYDLEHEFESMENARNISNAIKQLTPRQQELIYKVFYQNMTVAEIARTEGVHRTATSHALQRALKKLKLF